MFSKKICYVWELKTVNFSKKFLFKMQKLTNIYIKQVSESSLIRKLIHKQKKNSWNSSDSKTFKKLSFKNRIERSETFHKNSC